MRKYAKAVVNLLIALVVLLLIIFLAPRLIFFFMPFVVGWLIALIASPLVVFFEQKLKVRRQFGGVVVIVTVLALIVFLLYLGGAFLVDQASNLIENVPEMWNGFKEDLAEMATVIDTYLAKLPGTHKWSLNELGTQLGDALTGIFGKISTPTIEAAGNFAKSLPSIFIGVIMALLSSYLFVADRKTINEWFTKHTPAVVQLKYKTIRGSLVKCVGGYFKAQFKIEIWIFLLIAVGLAVLHVQSFALIAIGIAFLDFLPFFGSGAVLLPWAVVRIFTGDYRIAIGLLIIWGAGQLVRQLIQPKIVGDSMGVKPLPTLLLLFIGYKLGSVIGMILAVPIGLVLYSMYEDGAFQTTQDSICILVTGLNKFRRIEPEDLEEVEEFRRENFKAAEKLREK